MGKNMSILVASEPVPHLQRAFSKSSDRYFKALIFPHKKVFSDHWNLYFCNQKVLKLLLSACFKIPKARFESVF
jgi:hypothetical protein